MNPAQKKIQSPIGTLYLVASDRGLQGVFWQKQNVRLAKSTEQKPSLRILEKAEFQLNEYFRGQRKSFDLPLDPEGSEFQKSVWRKLSKIPYGSTVSYKKIAALLGKPNASRAVGTANGKNPLCIIVPCHRVIASNGSLGGYSGGFKIKAKLLDLERRTKPVEKH